MTELIDRLLERAIEIQQIPAPTFEEARRAEFVRDGFLREGLVDVELDPVGNVLGRLPGSDGDRLVVVSAHLDTVFPADTSLQVTRTPERVSGPGIGDNSLGAAGLFGLVWGLRSIGATLPGDVWLAANVGEEGLGDLRGMRSLVDRFGRRPLAYIVIEGMALGHVYHRALGVQRYRIDVRTAGGHSWTDYGQPSAIHELSTLVARLDSLVLPSEPRTSWNVGRISGGTSVNTIASDAWIELDLRSENEATLQSLVEQVEMLVRASRLPGVEVEMTRIGRRPAGEIPETHPLVQLARQCLRDQGFEPGSLIGSTDANIPLHLGVPAVCIGLTTGSGAHTVNEFIHIEPLSRGMAQLVQLVTKVWEID